MLPQIWQVCFLNIAGISNLQFFLLFCCESAFPPFFLLWVKVWLKYSVSNGNTNWVLVHSDSLIGNIIVLQFSWIFYVIVKWYSLLYYSLTWTKWLINDIYLPCYIVYFYIFMLDFLLVSRKEIIFFTMGFQSLLLL